MFDTPVLERLTLELLTPELLELLTPELLKLLPLLTEGRILILQVTGLEMPWTSFVRI